MFDTKVFVGYKSSVLIFYILFVSTCLLYSVAINKADWVWLGKKTHPISRKLFKTLHFSILQRRASGHKRQKLFTAVMSDRNFSHIRRWLILYWRHHGLRQNHPALTQPPHAAICSQTQVPLRNLVGPLPSQRAPPPPSPPNNNTVHGEGSAVRHGNPSSLSSQQPHTHTHVFQPFTKNVCFFTHTHVQKHAACSWTLRPHCSFHLPAPFSACCWHHYVNTNTIFLSSSPGRSVPLISPSFFCGRSGNGDGGLEGSGTWVSCGKPECSLWPHSMQSLSPRPLLSCSISVSLLAENHRRLHADRILRPQMIWENMPR